MILPIDENYWSETHSLNLDHHRTPTSDVLCQLYQISAHLSKLNSRLESMNAQLSETNLSPTNMADDNTATSVMPASSATFENAIGNGVSHTSNACFFLRQQK